MAATRTEAVAMLGGSDYDAVLMDCQIPEMDISNPAQLHIVAPMLERWLAASKVV